MINKWISIDTIGQLYLEKILVTFTVPILFVCKDSKNRKYLCLNIDEDLGTTLVVEISIDKLISLLNNEITIDSAFRNAKNNKILFVEYDSVLEEIVTEIKNYNLLSKDVLLDKGDFLEIYSIDISNYTKVLNSEEVKFNESNSENVKSRKVT